MKPDIALALAEHFLDGIRECVFVVDAKGTLLHANATGRARLAREGAALVTALTAARQLRDPAYRIVAIAAAGRSKRPACYLIIAPRWSLTRRQHEVLACVLQGLSNASISEELGISERTVEVHLSAILDRTRCVSRAQLIAEALSL